MTLLYLFGPPGAGKTTLLATLLAGWRVVASYTEPFAFRFRARAEHQVIELGAIKPPFSGTDTLSMSVGPTACAWITERPHPLIVGEGDRLAYGGFWRAAGDAGYRLALMFLDGPDQALEERRQYRARMAGREPQNERWVRGRASKARNLAQVWGAQRLDATLTTDELVQQIRTHPLAEEVFAA